MQHVPFIIDFVSAGLFKGILNGSVSYRGLYSYSDKIPKDADCILFGEIACFREPVLHAYGVTAGEYFVPLTFYREKRDCKY